MSKSQADMSFIECEKVSLGDNMLRKQSNLAKKDKRQSSSRRRHKHGKGSVNNSYIDQKRPPKEIVTTPK